MATTPISGNLQTKGSPLSVEGQDQKDIGLIRRVLEACSHSKKRSEQELAVRGLELLKVTDSVYGLVKAHSDHATDIPATRTIALIQNNKELALQAQKLAKTFGGRMFAHGARFARLYDGPGLVERYSKECGMSPEMSKKVVYQALGWPLPKR